MFKNALPWLLPILLMAIIAPFTPALDLYFSHYYYTQEGSAPGHFTYSPFFMFLYDYGPIPALLMGISSMLVYLISFLNKKWKKWRRPALYLMLVYAIGAGVIVHGVFKENWGRPRPIQTTEFGGQQQFRPFYSPYFANPERAKSFVCGHCSTGFVFFALYFLGKRRGNFMLTWGGMALALTLGILLSMARIAQGGHFFSDTIMTALIMWLTAYVLDWLILSEETT